MKAYKAIDLFLRVILLLSCAAASFYMFDCSVGEHGREYTRYVTFGFIFLFWVGCIAFLLGESLAKWRDN